jgi:hypothetical protein
LMSRGEDRRTVVTRFSLRLRLRLRLRLCGDVYDRRFDSAVSFVLSKAIRS